MIMAIEIAQVFGGLAIYLTGSYTQGKKNTNQWVKGVVSTDQWVYVMKMGTKRFLLEGRGD